MSHPETATGPAGRFVVKDPSLALTPPMGWNSWDSFGWAASERDVMEAASVMADRLLPYGYDTLVIDGGWSYPMNLDKGIRFDATTTMDAFGRFRPDPGRFPSAMQSRGFGPLAEALHRRGLKFGIHAMRGVPRAAAHASLPILGASTSCADIADRSSLCTWSDAMYGVQPDAPGAQAWYDSLFALWAEWGVDFVKMDDISSPYHAAEIELVAAALKRCGRPMVLSLSPGNATPSHQLDHLHAHAHLWRISADFWDRWSDLRTAFDLLAQWSPHARPSGWPDADMLPVGLLSIHGNELGLSVRWSRLTEDEVQTLITLWCVARSPLMIGGHLSTMPEPVLALLTHPDLLRLHRHGVSPREVARNGDLIVWRSQADGQHYLACFNTGDAPIQPVLDPAWFGVISQESVTEVFMGMASPPDQLAPSPIPPHGVHLYRW